MPNAQCPNCGAVVDRADDLCPECDFERPYEDAISDELDSFSRSSNGSPWVLLVLIGVLGLFCVIGGVALMNAGPDVENSSTSSHDPDDNTNQSPSVGSRGGASGSSGTSSSSTSSQDWYEGGTLHDAKLSEWRDATRSNRLATAGDFVAKLKLEKGIPKSQIDLQAMKPDAKRLVKCITETGGDKSEAAIDSQKVASIAVLCMELMGMR